MKQAFAILCFVVATLLSAAAQAQQYATIVSTEGGNVFQPVPVAALAVGKAAHTPMSEVVRVINLLPRPQVAFVDYGCGYDARWCVAAAEKWKCKCVGVERDSRRAAAARERVRNLGLDNQITIVEGNAEDLTTVPGDVGVAYLYPETLVKLKPRIQKFKAFASYIHQPPIAATRNGDTWIYQQQVVSARPAAVWQGTTYSGRVCNSPHCQMCNSIQYQLGY